MNNSAFIEGYIEKKAFKKLVNRFKRWAKGEDVYDEVIKRINTVDDLSGNIASTVNKPALTNFTKETAKSAQAQTAEMRQQLMIWGVIPPTIGIASGIGYSAIQGHGSKKRQNEIIKKLEKIKR